MSRFFPVLAGAAVVVMTVWEPVQAFEFIPRLAPSGGSSSAVGPMSLIKKPSPADTRGLKESPYLNVPSCTMFRKDGCVVVTCNNGEKFNSCDWCKSESTKEICTEKKDSQGCTYQLCKIPGKKAVFKNAVCSGAANAQCKEIGMVEGCRKVMCPGKILPEYDCSALSDATKGYWVTYSVASGKCEYTYSATEAGVKYCAKKCSAFGGVTLSKSDLVLCPQ